MVQSKNQALLSLRNYLDTLKKDLFQNWIEQNKKRGFVDNNFTACKLIKEEKIGYYIDENDQLQKKKVIEVRLDFE